MAAAATEGFIHLSRPLAPASAGLQNNIAPLSVNVQPQVSQSPR
jgi:translation initiation factor 3 subunit F